MPELPEVERVRRELTDRLIDRRVSRVTIHRRDIITGEARRPALLEGDVIASLDRRGKQLAIVGASGKAVCVHLGMSGQLFHLPPRSAPPRRDHVHISWSLNEASRAPAGRLIFRDPRRFGGIWTFPSLDDLHSARWSVLGPDALSVTSGQLRGALARSARAIKAALLDQSTVAGVGNIYADEALFAARVHPASPCHDLQHDDWPRLASEIRRVLRGALRVGGSTFRDYVGGDGLPGGYQKLRKVYSRAGLPCLHCRATLESSQIAQRTTVWCPVCQPPRAPAGRTPKHRTNHTFSTTRSAHSTSAKARRSLG